MSVNAPVAPWYRQPWFWFIAFFPLITIVWGVVMIIIAANVEDTMVTDDYSKKGLAINMELKKDEKAYTMGMVGALTFEGRDLVLRLKSDQGPADYQYLILSLYHPTLAGRDRTIQFNSNGNGLYSGKLLKDIQGRWYYMLRDPADDWQIKGELRLPAEGSTLTLQADKPIQG